jgi:hypothetical protein
MERGYQLYRQQMRWAAGLRTPSPPPPAPRPPPPLPLSPTPIIEITQDASLPKERHLDQGNLTESTTEAFKKEIRELKNRILELENRKDAGFGIRENPSYLSWKLLVFCD